jgi:FMN phosphatase YigB (HAD superfamily)
MFKNILFDLDGTLLPLEPERFLDSFLSLLAKTYEPKGYDGKKVIDAFWSVIDAMVKNDGEKPCKEVYWEKWSSLLGGDVAEDERLLEEFYKGNFEKVRVSCGFNPEASLLVRKLTKEGKTVILATNPVYPASAMEKRINWAGLEYSDFKFVSAYENSKYCKPSPMYYKEILDKFSLDPKETLMVGNDFLRDMAAKEVGISVFLLTDCPENCEGADIESVPNGSFNQLRSYIDNH